MQANDWYGLAWDESQATGGYTRRGTLAGISATYDATYKPFSNVPELLLPLQRKMRRCLRKNKVTQYYLHSTDGKKKEDGSAADLSGADGQVMLELPELWYRYEYAGTTHIIDVSPTSKAGWIHYPGGYLAAYKATLYDASAGSYVGGANGDDVNADFATDYLGSVSGILPLSNLNRPEFRTLAGLTGDRCHLADNYHWHIYQMLLAIEYADLNFQKRVSIGLTDVNSTDWANYNNYAAIVPTGLTDSLGNQTGEVAVTVTDWYRGTVDTVAANKCIQSGRFASWDADYIGMTIRNDTTLATATIVSKDSNDQLSIDADIFSAIGQRFTIVGSELHSQTCSIRGLEEPFGHLYEERDGLNVHNSTEHGSRLYICNDFTKYADNTDTGYTLAGYLPLADGYIKTLLPTALGFYPKITGDGASSGSYVTDYYYTYADNAPDSGWRGWLVSAAASDGGPSGVFFGYSYYAASYRGRNVSARLGETKE